VPAEADDGRGAAGERVDLRPPGEVRWIARRLEEAGYGAWAVGGAVRDALAGLDPGDWDLTTAARPGEVRRLFRRTVPVGIEHGTVGVLGRDGKLYEVTTFRRDVETDGRHARVVFADRLEEDLERRDFTMNAVAWHPLTGEVRDPHGGMRDLRRGVLRTVGDPEDRFREDRLRVLRALRFAGRFELRIEERTWEAACASADRLGHLSAERIREELLKVLASPRPSAALRLYEASGVLARLYPELQACVGLRDAGPGGVDVWTRQLRTVDAVRPHRLQLRVAALLCGLGKPATRVVEGDGPRFPRHAGAGAALARELLRRLRASNAEIDRVTHLVAHHADLPGPAASDAEVRRWVRLVGPEFLPDLFRLRFATCRAGGAGQASDLLALLRRVRSLLAARPALAVGDLAIDGADLRGLGLPPGPLYGEILRDLLERVTDDPALNDRAVLLGIVREQIG
jgi:tRNA nucleotidyltransferase (CCA-adding enzyme)